MTTRLSLYNRALSHLGSRRLASLTEDVKERYELDAVYAEVQQECLQMGGWKFAIRSSQLNYDVGILPTFGSQYVYGKPTDFVRLCNICSDSNFVVEVESYDDENGRWYTNIPTIYVRYVSNGASYGLNLGLYPETYCAYFGTAMALRCSLPITRDKYTRNDLVQLSDRYLARARRIDAIDESVKVKPPGRWTTSRLVGYGPTFSNGRMRF